MEWRISKGWTYTDLEHNWVGEGLVRAHERGYPQIYNDAIYYVLMVDDYPVGYTTATLVYDAHNKLSFVFVGNTYVKLEFRGNGFHKELLKERNEQIKKLSVPIVAILNPFGKTPTERLRDVVVSLGYEPIAHNDELFTKLHLDMKEYEMWCL
jgi:GNAT superfamily N-acetyltransferase